MGKNLAIVKFHTVVPTTTESTEYFVHGTERIARITNENAAGSDINYSEATFFLYDHLGNTRVSYKVNASSVPQTVYAADYFPYGKVLREYANGDGGDRYLTTAHERDKETGLDYRGARYYDSDIARFLSIDPWAAKYPAWSTYNYVMGNPINLIDPNGKGPTDWVKNIETGEYIWDNTVTNQFQAHEGQRYIGKTDQDIVKDLFGKTNFIEYTQDYGIFNVENDAGYVAAYYAKVSTSMNVDIRANVSYNGDARTFNGINFFANTEGFTYAPLPPDKQMEFIPSDVKFHGYDMEPVPQTSGSTIKASGGSGGFQYSWTAARVKSDFNKSFTRTISIEGQYTFGGVPLLHPNAAGLILPTNKTSVSIILPYNNK